MEKIEIEEVIKKVHKIRKFDELVDYLKKIWNGGNHEYSIYEQMIFMSDDKIQKLLEYEEVLNIIEENK